MAASNLQQLQRDAAASETRSSLRNEKIVTMGRNLGILMPVTTATTKIELSILVMW